MHFTSSLASLITTGLLATSAIAGVIPSSGGAKSIRRRDDEEFAELAAKHCGGSGLFRRDDVPTDTGRGANADTPLTTYGLSTCVGMVAVGTLKEGQQGNNHFMTHISMGNPSGWNQFKAAYEADKDKIDGIKGYITTPKDSLNTENVKKLLTEDGDTPDDDYVEEYLEFLSGEVDHWTGELESLVGIAGEGKHDINSADGATMESDGRGVVKVNGSPI